MRSCLKIELVKKYRDKNGCRKVKGGRHLRQSAQYPIGLGLQARVLNWCLNIPCAKEQLLHIHPIVI